MALNYKLKSVCLALLAAGMTAGLCGCETTTMFGTLPSGAPPPGEIIREIKDNNTLPSPDKAVNQMATQLTFKLVSDPGKPSIKLESINDAGLGEALLKSLVDSKVAFDDAKPNVSSIRHIMESRLEGGKWTVKLLSSGEQRFPLWGASIELDANSLQVAK